VDQFVAGHCVGLVDVAVVVLETNRLRDSNHAVDHEACLIARDALTIAEVVDRSALEIGRGVWGKLERVVLNFDLETLRPGFKLSLADVAPGALHV